MRDETRRELARRIREHLDAGTTDMAESVLLNPVEAYTSERRGECERRILFRHHPLLVGLSCDLPEPGSYVTESATDVPLLVVRDRDGTLRAFANVCRHRGSRVVEGRGTATRTLTCPYHAWSYGLDGALVRVPCAEGFAGVDTGEHGLRALACAERHGLVFVVPDPTGEGDAVDVASYVGPLGDELESYGLASWHHFATRTLEPRLNWKIAVETFLEAYHLQALHRDSVGPIFFGNLCLSDAFGANHRMVAVRRTFAGLATQQEAAGELLRHTIELYTLFPNTVLVHQADHVEVWRMFPRRGRVDRCTVYLSLYVPETPTTESARRHWQANVDLALKAVDDEDFRLGEGIQIGFASGTQDHVTYGRNEPALIHFHRSLARALCEGTDSLD